VIGWHAEHPIFEQQTHWRTKWKLFRIQFRQNPAALEHIPMNQPLQSSKCSGTKGSASSTHLDIFHLSKAYYDCILGLPHAHTHTHTSTLAMGNLFLKAFWSILESLGFKQGKYISSVLCLENISQSVVMNITFPCGGLKSLSKI